MVREGLRRWEWQKQEHEEKCRIAKKTIRQEYPKLDGLSKAFNPTELSRKTEKYNGISHPTAKKCLEEFVQKGTEVNGQIQKLGPSAGANLYVRDDPLLPPQISEDLHLKPTRGS